MNHDMTHCLDYDKQCPTTCFYAMLNADYRKRYLDFMGRPLSWSHLRGADGCPLRKTEVKE